MYHDVCIYHRHCIRARSRHFWVGCVSGIKTDRLLWHRILMQGSVSVSCESVVFTSTNHREVTDPALGPQLL